MIQARGRGTTCGDSTRAPLPLIGQQGVGVINLALGMTRRGELCGFRWSGTDLDRGVLAVERPVLQLGGRLAESTAKTRAGEWLVFLDAETAGLLRAPQGPAGHADARWRRLAGP